MLKTAGATLVLACRDVKKGIEVKKEILKKTPKYQGQIFVKHLDLNSFENVVKFAEGIHSEFKDIYALVNNAGVFCHPQELTEDNFDVTLQTNYLGIYGDFLLRFIRLLLNHIVKI